MPQPPEIETGESSLSIDSFVVPAATIGAALLAAAVLTLNETLKLRREDRRQWDKEIRDHCAKALTAADAIIKSSEDIHAQEQRGDAIGITVATATLDELQPGTAVAANLVRSLSQRKWPKLKSINLDTSHRA